MILLLLLLEIFKLYSHLEISLFELGIVSFHFQKFLAYLIILLIDFFELISLLFQLNIQFFINFLYLLNFPFHS